MFRGKKTFKNGTHKYNDGLRMFVKCVGAGVGMGVGDWRERGRGCWFWCWAWAWA